MNLKIKMIIFLSFFYPFALCSEQGEKIQEKIEKELQAYVEKHGITGIAVAAIGRENLEKFELITTRGNLSEKSLIPVNHYTEFRIGPLTHLFNAAILAYFVREGRISLNDPISKFLPKSMKVPTYRGKEITLLDLAVHTSGLPDMPHTLSSRSSFSVSQMYLFLSKYQLTREPGMKYEFSSLGYALLANLLARIGKSYFPDLVDQILFRSLNLNDTMFSLTYEQKSRLATGYEKGRGILPFLSEKVYSIFVSSEGLYSTAQDMLRFLSFNLGKERTSLNAILPLMQKAYYHKGSLSIGLGWHIKHLNQKILYFSEGELFGFSVYMGIIPDCDCGVVILANREDISMVPLSQKILSLILSK